MISCQLSGSPPMEDRDVAAGVLGVVGALFVGDDPALWPDRAQQRARQRTGAGAGLQHARPGKDVALVHDLGGVLGIDHLRTARHRHHVVDQQRAEHQKECPVAGFDDAALLQPDEGVVGDRAAMGVKLTARGQFDRVMAALGVGELDALADGERTGCWHAI